MTTHVNTRNVPVAHRDELKRIAEARRMSLNSLMLEVIEKYVAKPARKRKGAGR